MDLLGTTSSIGRKHPSGVVLPFALRERLRLQGKTTAAATPLPKLASTTASTSTSSAHKLEHTLLQLSRATIQVQKQIQRAEEIYHDETPLFNIYKGWEGYINSSMDNHTRGNNDNAMHAHSSGGHQQSQHRRNVMPTDWKWCSGSCTDLNRRYILPITQAQAAASSVSNPNNPTISSTADNTATTLTATIMPSRVSATATPEQIQAAQNVVQAAAPMAALVKPVVRLQKNNDSDKTKASPSDKNDKSSSRKRSRQDSGDEEEDDDKKQKKKKDKEDNSNSSDRGEDEEEEKRPTKKSRRNKEDKKKKPTEGKRKSERADTPTPATTRRPKRARR